MVLKDRQCRVLVYELSKSKFIHDIIVIRALKHTRSDPGLWNTNQFRFFKFFFNGLYVKLPLGQAIHLCCKPI